MMVRARGFTLLEVMVALVIVTLGITTVWSVSGNYARQSAELRDRTQAQWIAANRLAEYRIEGQFPETGTESGTVTFAGRRWAWTALVSPAPGEDDLRRIDIAVANAETPDAPVAVLTGFIGRVVGFVQAPPQEPPQ